MHTCKVITHLLSDALDRPLSMREQLAVFGHLPMCSGCRRYREQITLIREVAHDWAQGVIEDPAGPDDEAGTAS
ncbi:zf-HC2 domain-containing protein [Trinickia fusca]|uniref:Zf-HC2 domain-containing protein n=1 Tax=Trinickia fusca TaxID=2419777 RepID=A0A494XC09_9BURK|nr:zf-HC2 domain-containing protein [Trinickia fusca]RKP48387.1 zf-HC2 domain-containing protein [Trinickia fusca]